MSSGTKVPTAAVLATPAQKRAKALFCLTTRRCSVPRATTQRRRRCISRCDRDAAACEMFFLFTPHKDEAAAQALVQWHCLGRRRGAERQRVLKGLPV